MWLKATLFYHIIHNIKSFQVSYRLEVCCNTTHIFALWLWEWLMTWAVAETRPWG